MDYGRFSALTFRTAFVIFALASVHAMANAQDAAAQLQSIAKANSLDAEGKPPFHIKMTFQLYDLGGHPTDTGTVEEWWAAPGQSKIVVTAASLKSAEAVPLDGASGLDPRERFLIENLLSAEVHPAPVTAPSAEHKVEERDRAFSGVTLRCFNVAPTEDQGTGRQLFSYCAQKDIDALRFQLEGTFESMSRNQMGSFHETQVALSVEIAYNDRLAVTGKVIALQSFDPAKSSVQFTASTASTSGILPDHKGVVVDGHRLKGVPPFYPQIAKSAHLGGTVVLHAIISKEGKIENLFVLASPHPALGASAMDAVKQWTYQPYTLRGKPVEVDTVIDVNFMLGGGR